MAPPVQSPQASQGQVTFASPQTSSSLLKRTFTNYPMWKHATYNLLQAKNWLYACENSFYRIAAAQQPPWTEDNRIVQKRQYARDSHKALQLIKLSLEPDLKQELQLFSSISAQHLLDLLETKYLEKLPSIRIQFKAAWDNWSLIPPSVVESMALLMISARRKQKKPGQLFVSGFRRLEDIWFMNLSHGVRIADRDFIIKYFSEISKVKDGELGKQEFLAAVGGIVWAEAAPTIWQVGKIVKSVRITSQGYLAPR